MPPLKKNLLLTLDAMGTIIKPRLPIFEQYREEAERYGFRFKRTLKHGEIDKTLEIAFKRAFQGMLLSSPHFGHEKGEEGYKSWWTEVISKTLESVSEDAGPQPTTWTWEIPKKEKKKTKKTSDISPSPSPSRSRSRSSVVDPELSAALLDRFSSDKAYILQPDVLPFLGSLFSKSEPLNWRYPVAQSIHLTPPEYLANPTTLLGIVSNGDPRIPMVFESFGIRKFFSFFTLSSEVGFSKPARKIFREARATALKIVDPYKRTIDSMGGEIPESYANWDFIHVGDDWMNDYVAPRKLANWQAVWVDRGGGGFPSGSIPKLEKAARSLTKIFYPPKTLEELEQIRKAEQDRLSSIGLPKISPVEHLQRRTVRDLNNIPALFHNLPDEFDQEEWEEEMALMKQERIFANRSSPKKAERRTLVGKRLAFEQKQKRKRDWQVRLVESNQPSRGQIARGRAMADVRSTRTGPVIRKTYPGAYTDPFADYDDYPQEDRHRGGPRHPMWDD